VLRNCPRVVEEDDVGRMSALFRDGAGGTEGAPGGDVPCPVNSQGRIICGLP